GRARSTACCGAGSRRRSRGCRPGWDRTPAPRRHPCRRAGAHTWVPTELWSGRAPGCVTADPVFALDRTRRTPTCLLRSPSVETGTERMNAYAEDGVGWIVYNNPDKHNAMTADMLAAVDCV